MKSKKRDIILIIEGGAMSGIFGAGVATSFEKANFYNRIDKIYAVSAGAHVGAYFLSKKTIKGSEIYSKDLISKRYKFIEETSLLKIIKKVFNLVVYRRNMHILDLEVLKFIQRTKTRLDTKKIKKSPIDFKVRIFDTKDMKIKYMNGKKNTIEVINISSYVPPYMYLKTRYKYRYDGALVPSDNFIEIIKKNRDKKIIYILNEKRNLFRKIKDFPFRIIHLILKSLYFGIDFMTYYIVHFFDTPTIEELKMFKNVYIIHPKGNVRRISKNAKKLRKFYYEGVDKGKKAIKELNL